MQPDGIRGAASTSSQAYRQRLSRSKWRDIRRAVDTLGQNDDVYSVELHQVKVAFVRHPTVRQQLSGIRQQQRQEGEEPSGAPSEPKPAGNRQQKRAERNAQRANVWHAAQRVRQPDPAATAVDADGNRRQEPPAAAEADADGSRRQELPPPPPPQGVAELAPTTSMCITPTKPTQAPPRARASSEPQGSKEASPAQVPHALVRGAGMDHAPMHSPGGGPSTGHAAAPARLCEGGASSAPAAFAIGPMQRPEPPNPQGTTSYHHMIQHMRMHEYPPFMQFHMQQGASQEQAHALWFKYEHARVGVPMTRELASHGHGVLCMPQDR